MTRVGTNEVFSFDPPAEAAVAENWRRRGASADWRRLSSSNWEFPFVGTAFSNLVVFADGRVRLSSEDGLRPVAAPLGLAPAARRPQVSANLQESVSIRANPWTNSPSSFFWHSLTPSNSLVLTWRDALLHREAANPVSFQAELFPSGSFVFRYDFSRLGDEGLLTNVAAVVRRKGQKGQEGQEGLEGQLSRSLTSLSFRSGDEILCDAARAAFDDALGGTDPLACPPGSTNTVWEHYVYAGATNGAFAYPQSTESVAVLRVTVAGSGRGELLVGGRAVPLVGWPAAGGVSHGVTEARSEDGSAGASEMRPCQTAGGQVLRASVSPCETSATLLLPVPRGRTVPLYLRADGSMSVSFASSDFAFGRLPDLAANRLTGRINFPNAMATTPCFHDAERINHGLSRIHTDFEDCPRICTNLHKSRFVTIRVNSWTRPRREDWGRKSHTELRRHGDWGEFVHGLHGLSRIGRGNRIAA